VPTPVLEHGLRDAVGPFPPPFAVLGQLVFRGNVVEGPLASTRVAASRKESEGVCSWKRLPQGAAAAMEGGGHAAAEALRVFVFVCCVV